MFEIEKMEKEFDYSLVDNETADFLRSCEYEMNGIAEDARLQFGRVLKKAQEKLAKYGSGVFSKWYESGGLDRNDVYYAINLFDSSRNLEERQKKNFLNAPKTLQKEVMKKNAPDDLKEKVLDGDITTHKQYKEMLRKLKESEQAKQQAESQAELERQERERLEEELSNVEPEKIEVIPDDYDFYKGNYESAVRLQNRYKEQMEEMRKELTNKGVAETKEVERLKSEEKCLKRKINSLEKLHDVQTHLEIVISQVTTKTHSLNIADLRNEYQVLDDFEKTLDEVIRICNQLKDKLQNKNTIEGEIING